MRLLSNWIGKLSKVQPATHDVNVVAARFIQLFADHGIERTQIPRVFGEISLAQLSTPENLLSVLTPELIDKAANLFGIRSEWLEGIDDRIYEYLAINKQPEVLLRLLGRILSEDRSPGELIGFPVRVLTTHMNLDRSSGEVQMLAPVLLEYLFSVGEEPVYRYHVFQDGFDWDHYPCRIELKAITRHIRRLRSGPVPLFEVSRQEMEAVLEGAVIPRRFLSGCLITNPSLEDYALSVDESRVAKEADELPSVLAYANEHSLGRIHIPKSETIPDLPSPDSSVPTTNIAPTLEPVTEQQVTRSGKRAAGKKDWDDLRSAASVLWASDPSMPIKDMIQRLKKMPKLKAAKYEESAIRKHIADLAPDGIRGKSGRKPKKSG